MTWFDVSLKGKLMMTLESAGVVKENPTVKKDREFKILIGGEEVARPSKE